MVCHNPSKSLMPGGYKAGHIRKEHLGRCQCHHCVSSSRAALSRGQAPSPLCAERRDGWMPTAPTTKERGTRPCHITLRGDDVPKVLDVGIHVPRRGYFHTEVEEGL